LNLPSVLLVAAALLLTTGGCDIEPRCPDEALPAGVEVEVLPTNVVSDEGCDGLGASVDDEPLRYTTDDPIMFGTHEKCPTETLAAPDVEELYGVSIDFCYKRSNGFTCEGHLVSCAEQKARIEVSLLFRDLAAGTQGTRQYFVDISADEHGDCPRVKCEQQFDAATTLL
jgi:hypothetical protein